jgi:hypothetical protein
MLCIINVCCSWLSKVLHYPCPSLPTTITLDNRKCQMIYRVFIMSHFCALQEISFDVGFRKVVLYVGLFSLQYSLSLSHTHF